MAFRYINALICLAIATYALGDAIDVKLDVVFSSEFQETTSEGHSRNVTFVLTNLDEFYNDRSSMYVELINSNPEIATVQPTKFDISNGELDSNWTAYFNLTGRFLGYSHISVKLFQKLNSSDELVAESLPAKTAVVRIKKLVDTIFVFTVAGLLSVSFINMGCTLDLQVVAASIRRPVGPIIGFCCQYLFMPLCSFGLAKLLLTHNAALQLGLFVTGCSPGGGASNIWTHVLGGNLHLSITMTAISTIAAFAMMPIWTITLGRLIFTDGTIKVPYGNIASIAAAFAVPLLIGLGIQHFWPKVAAVLAQMLKPLAMIIIAVTIGLGTYANLYMFYLLDWQVLVSSFSLAWLGYAFGGTCALVCRRSWPDALAVAIETGIQNTGIAIFVLRLMLEQPEADINTVVPVTVAIASSLPLCFLYVLQKCVLHRYGKCLPVADNLNDINDNKKEEEAKAKNPDSS